MTRRGDASADPPGVPTGTLEHGIGVLLAASVLLAHLRGGDLEVDPVGVEVQLLLPAVAAAAYGVGWAPVAPPRWFGSTACDVGPSRPEDDIALERLLTTFDHAPDAEQVAARAQQWRLPVCPYRHRSRDRPDPPVRWMSGPPPGDIGRPPAPLVVIDLTSHWAGPLATWLLAASGADVIKVEAAARPDGFRRPADRDGRGPTPLFDALNRSKRSIELDLREPAARDRFVELVAGADLVVDSFSRRVLPNFGLATGDLVRDHERLLAVSLPAFPDGSSFEVAYGPAIHAVRGLGDTGDGGLSEPAVAYPDPIAGFTAYFTALALVVGRGSGSSVRRAEVTLFDAVGPLLERAPDPNVARREAHPGERLLGSGAASGWEPVPDAAGVHRALPTAPIRGDGLPVASTPAPVLGGPLAPLPSGPVRGRA